MEYEPDSGSRSDGSDGQPAAAPALPPAPASSDDAVWEDAITAAMSAVVSITFATVTSFSAYRSGRSVATGFVVALTPTAGYILTNRHVVRPGPVVAYASFSNYEEVRLSPVYRDGVHDFGFYTYDPAELKFITPTPIVLAPDRARVGIPIRVIGNDAAEKMSILQSTLARLDRPAPFCGSSSDSDFNTFYYQAASGTSGGSSGSPVLERGGAAVALNAAGSRSAAASYYLPLDRPARALAALLDGRPVSRGTITTVWAHSHYDELRRLGLAADDEAAARAAFPDGTGLLVASKVLTGSATAAAGLLVGDILWAVDGVPISTFLPLEAVLDDNVGASVVLTLIRAGAALDLELPVLSLDAITPAAFVEFSGGVIHDVSYHTGLNRSLPLRGAFVCSSGFALSAAGFASGSVITSIGDEPVADAAAFAAIVGAFPDGHKVTLHGFSVSDPSRAMVSDLRVDRKWFAMATHTRNDTTGVWDVVDAPLPPLPHTPEPQSTHLLKCDAPLAALLQPSLVVVRAALAHVVDGAVSSQFVGAGLVVDADRGLVLVDRGTVPNSVADVRISFANSVEVDADIVFLHPTHNFAIIAYDPVLIGTTPVASAVLSAEPLVAGARTHLVGINREETLVSRTAAVTKVSKFGVRRSKAPTFRSINVEAVRLDLALACIGGVLADDAGHVTALWAAFLAKPGKSVAETSVGIPVASVIGPFLAAFLARPSLDSPLALAHAEGVQLWTVSLTKARAYGLPQHWVDVLESVSDTHEALKIEQIAAGSPAHGLLRPGDLVLACDGTPVGSFAAWAAANAHADTVAVTVWRDGAEAVVDVATSALESDERHAFAYWQGALLQSAFLELRLYQSTLPSRVYIGRVASGSSAHLWKLPARTWLVAVNDTPTPDLPTALTVLATHASGESVRLRTVSLRGRESVTTLRVDLETWPTAVWRNNGTTWSRT